MDQNDLALNVGQGGATKLCSLESVYICVLDLIKLLS